MSVFSGIQGVGLSGNRHKQDFYPTPPDVTKARMKVLNLREGTKVWEPACGTGEMVRAMTECGMSVIGTDIKGGIDYLSVQDLPENTGWIITNPPFSIAEEFIRHSATFGIPFAMLLKAQYFHAAKRMQLFHEIKPAFIFPLTWRPDFTGDGHPLMDVMWTVWVPGWWNATTEYMPIGK